MYQGLKLTSRSDWGWLEATRTGLIVSKTTEMEVAVEVYGLHTQTNNVDYRALLNMSSRHGGA